MARDGLPWLKIGCLSIIVLPILAVLILIAVARLSSGGEVVERTLVRKIPAATDANIRAGDRVADGVAPRSVPGRVKLNFSGAELYLTPAPAGSPISVQAAYDGSPEDIGETFDPGTGNGWTYEVEFHAAADSFSELITGMFGNSYPQIIVSLPSGAPMALEIALAQGGGIVDLGGLWLSTVELTLQQGGLELEVSKPLQEPLQRFESVGSMGGMQLSSLGNASPRVLEITQRMGGIDLDLRGAWRQDAEIDLSIDMGGGALSIPDDVVVRGLSEKGVKAKRNADDDVPVLDIRTSVNMGEIEVIR